MSSEKKYVVIPIIISIFALILSQTQPLYVYFKKPELDILIGKSVDFYEGWGNLGANIFIQLINTGDKSVNVEKMKVFIKRKDSNYSHIMETQSYYLQPESMGQNDIVSQIPFSYITVRENSIWTGFINVYADFQKSSQKKIQEFIQLVDKDIRSKQSPNNTEVIRIDNVLLTDIVSFSRKNLNDFDIGEYQLLAMVWLQGDTEPSLIRGYSFSVYEVDKMKLHRKELEYQFGGGILYPLNKTLLDQMRFNSFVTEIKDADTKVKLYKAYQKEAL